MRTGLRPASTPRAPNKKVCKRCGDEHTPSISTTRAARFKWKSSDEFKSEVQQYISADYHLFDLLMKNAPTMGNWTSHLLDAMVETVERLSGHAGSDACEKFGQKNKCDIKMQIAKCQASLDALDEVEAEKFEDVLRHQIYTLKLFHCEIFCVDNDDSVTDVSEEEDELEADGDRKTEVIDRKQDHDLRPADIVNAHIFDARYHYRRCMHCAGVNSVQRDCFFCLDFIAIGNALAKCTNCKRTGSQCRFEFEEDESTDDSVSEAIFPKAQDPGQKQRSSSTAPSASTSTLLTPAVAPTTAATSPSEPTTPPLQKQAAAVIPSVFIVTNGIGKRKSVAAPRDTNPLKQRRIDDSFQRSATRKPDVADIVSSNLPVDKPTILRQVSRLTTSFESFTDVCLRQVESDRKRSEQEAALKKCRLAHEESKRLYEERLRTYNESMQDFEESSQILKEQEQLCKESEPIYAATQEWLATRSASAGQDLEQEATSLLSSIKQGANLRNIAPALQHLRSVFAEFQRVQGELSQARKYKGARAYGLYTLMGHIHKEVDREVPAEDMVEGSSSGH